MKKKVTIIEPVIGIDINKYLETKKKADEISSSLSSTTATTTIARTIQQPLIELLDVQMKPSDDTVNDELELHQIPEIADDLKAPERWIPERTSIVHENKFILKKPVQLASRNSNRHTRASLYEPKHKSIPYEKQNKKERKGSIAIKINDTNDIITNHDNEKKEYMIKPIKGHNICIPR